MLITGANIGPQIRRLMVTCDFNMEDNKNPLFLENSVIIEVDKQIKLSSNLFPTTFSGTIMDISTLKGKRSVDWIHFLMYILPTAMLSFFDRETQKALLSISKVAISLCQHEIRIDDLKQLKEWIYDWLNWLGKMVDEKRLTSNVFTVNQHFLLHLPRLIEYLGPMKVYAAFAMETTIGQYKSRIKAKKKIGANAGNVMLEIAAENRLARINNPNKVKEKDALLEVGIDAEIWGPFGTTVLDQVEEQLGIKNLDSMIKSFYNRYYGINNAQVDPDDIIELGSNLRTPEGNVYGSCNNHVPGNRESFLAKLTLHVNTNLQNGSKTVVKRLAYFGNVVTYFRFKLANDEHRLLAIIRVFDVKKIDGEPWPYKVPSAKGKLIVTHVESIIDICGRSKYIKEREYICYPYQRLHDIEFGRQRFL